MQDSIFIKIINGEMPGERIYEDQQSIVLLTIEPLTEGHMLIIPKAQVDHLWDIDEVTYHHLWDVARQMSRKLKQVYGYERIGSIVEGYGIPHAHIHVFGYEQPLNETVLASIKRTKQVSPEQLTATAQKLRT